MSTWVHISDGTIATGATTSAVNVAYPGLPAAGNIIFLGCFSPQSSDSFTVSDTGFSALRTPITADGSVSLLWKVSDGTESGNFTVTNSGNYRSWYQTTLFSGGASVANFSASIVTSAVSQGGSGSNIAYPAATIPIANCLVLAGAVKIVNGTSISQPSPFPNRVGTGNNAAPGCFVWDYNIQTTATNITSGSWTIGAGDASQAHGSMIVVISPAADIVPFPPMSLGGIGVQMCQ